MKPHHYIYLAFSASLIALCLYQNAVTTMIIGILIGFAVAEVHSYICEVAESKYMESLEDKTDKP